MFPVVLIAATVAPCPPVDILDATRFPSEPTTIEAMIRIARSQQRFREEVHAWNGPDRGRYWQKETDWRWNCWQTLYAVQTGKCLVEYSRAEDGQVTSTWQGIPIGGTPREVKVKYLEHLRELLGDEDFYGGRMPEPLARYMR